ncbi:LamG-like jellyroll fold domain-containing protein [Hymenobacter properus]|uniref:LamG-like jellyroll fold domain-containing protein n=1 Tax=Hymenobacter properus TaxID=2791026 RepID=A0A931FML8_9BACT|nr:LamG-like jellyroll fold domain-containing protein [Hymenobacter properus]MBF9143236.1 hypothetical protein [Hymenobacter properus]MBR7722046.1 hypothetical protein [Microvirga sp. SRT04]
MKKIILLWLVMLLGLSPDTWAQRATIRSQSFELNEAVNYSSNTFDLRGSGVTLASNQYFTITSTNPPQNPADPTNYSFGSSADPVAIKNSAGTANYAGRFWIAEGVRCTSNTGTTCGRDPGNVTLTSFDARGYDNIEVTVSLADPRGQGSFTAAGNPTTPSAGSFNAADKIEIQYSVDGGANYITIGRFSGNNNNGSFGFMELDEDLDGDVNDEVKPTLNYKMTDYTFGNSAFATIPSSPASLMVRVVVDERGASEELAFDNIRVTGIPTSVQPPTLSDAQTATINYNEGDPATQITSTIAAGSATGLTGATVTIVSNVLSSNDELTFSPITGVISGSYLNGVLNLTGNASAAQYQTVLQSVRYRNSNSATARGGNRAIQFVVRNGTSTSTTVTRNVLVKALLSGPATLPYTQDFTNDEEGTRYASNSFVGSNGFAFTRTNATPFPNTTGGLTFTNISNGYYWYGVNTNAILQNPERVGRLETQQVDATAFSNLRFSIRLGAESGSSAAWQNTDSFKMYYRTGGSSGAWKLFGSFRGNTTSINGNAELKQDRTQDLANLPTLPAGTATLTPALTNFNFDIPADANGQLVDFKLELIADDTQAEFAFDLLQVTGTPTTTVNSIVRASANPTNAAAVNYTVTFGAPVTGLTAANFSPLATTGTTSGTVGTPVVGAGNTWTVPVTGITGSGTLTLSLTNDTNLSVDITTALPFAGETYTIDRVAPTVSSSNRQNPAANPTAATALTYRVTFSEAVTGITTSSFAFTTTGGVTGTIFSAASVSGSNGTQYDVTVTGVNGNGTGRLDVKSSGTGITDAVGNALSGGFIGGQTYTINQNVTVVSVTRLDLSPTAMSQVNYRVVFSGSVAGLTTGNFTPTVTSGSISGATVVSVSGSGTTYTVVVNTGSSTSTSTLRLDVANSTGASPSITNVPYTAGEQYTITKSFAAQPQLTIVGTGGTGGDVTAFVDVVQVLSGGAPFANALQNGSFETHNTLGSGNGTYGYNPTGANWTFNSQSGIANGGSAFNPVLPIPNGVAVGVVQGLGQLQQNLALPTGSGYQVSFQTSQRNCCNSSYNQALNVLLDGVFIGTIQPANNNAYFTFTSASFAVTAPALTATLSSSAGASGSTTGTTPIPFTVTFSAAVTGFAAADVSVTNGTITGGTVSGSGTTYTFTVTPVANGLVTVSVPANAAADANNTGNTAASPYSFTYAQPVTAAPVLTAPADGGFVNTTTPFYTGTAPANSTIRVYVDGALLSNTTTASASGTWTLTQPTALASGSHTVRATAQSSGAVVSASSTTNTFTVDTVAPVVLLSSPAGGSGGTTHATPIPFEVYTNEAVTGSASNIIVTNGVVTSGPTGSGFGPYSFTVTPTTPGTVTTVTLVAGAFRDRAGNPSAAAAPYSLTYVAGYTATPVLVTPGSLADLYAPHTFTGTAPAGSTVTVYVTPAAGGTLRNLGTTTATSSGTFSFTPSSPLATGDYNAYVTAQSSGLLVSSNSNTNRFTAINQAVYAGNTTVQASTDPVIQGSVDQVILRVAISITGGSNILDPRLTLQSFTFTTGGTTSPADITAARLYYGNASSFNPLFGAIGAVSNPNGSITIGLSSSSATNLGPGTYYYYLTYNVASTATAGNVLDATLSSVTISGQTYAATVPDPAGARPIVQASRVAGTALRFAGGSTPGYVAFGTAAGAQLSGIYTQMAWIKPAIGTGSATYYVLGNGTGTTAAAYLSVTGDGRLGAGFGTGSGTVLAQTGANVVTPNQWHHIAATKDAATLRVYLDGELVTSTASNFGASGTRVSFVGSAGTTGANFFPGDIDEVSQWQRPLSQSEIRQLRHLTLRGSEQDLVSYLQFNENGTTATDFVSSSVGTLTGATRPSSTAPVGFGTSSLLSVTGAGNYTFPGTNAAINFSTAGGTPYDVVVSRLGGLPLGTQPSAPGLKKIYTPAYWIVDRYSTSAFAANITYTLSATDITPTDAAAFATTLRLFKRGSNEDGPFEVIAANAANAAAGTVTFPVNSFGQTVIGTLGSSPLPVELVQFTAEPDGSVALLRWTTASERNSDHFAVEVSTDGRQFSQVGTVASPGATSQRTNYEFRDPKLLAYGSPLVYYRLRQIDRDGTFAYSAVRTVAVSAASTGLALFPNPTSRAATLTGAAPGSAVSVFDAVGRLVLSLPADAAGTAVLALPDGLTTGVYVVRVGNKALRLTVE